MADFKLPRLPASLDIVNADRKASPLFQRFWQTVVQLLEAVVKLLQSQIDQNAALIAAIAAAQSAADAANAAAEIATDAATDATAAAATATTAAGNAQTTADNIASASSLASSYPNDCSITGKAFEEEVSISAHLRIYGDGSNANVDAGTVPSGTVSYGGLYYIFYDDPTRTGGAVTYDATINLSDAVFSGANPNRHYVGSIVMPNSSISADTSGQPALPPTVIPPS